MPSAEATIRNVAASTAGHVPVFTNSDGSLAQCQFRVFFSPFLKENQTPTTKPRVVFPYSMILPTHSSPRSFSPSYLYVYIHIHVCSWVSRCSHLCISVCLLLFTLLFVALIWCVCMCVCVPVCICVYEHVHACVCVPLHICGGQRPACRSQLVLQCLSQWTILPSHPLYWLNLKPICHDPLTRELEHLPWTSSWALRLQARPTHRLPWVLELWTQVLILV